MKNDPTARVEQSGRYFNGWCSTYYFLWLYAGLMNYFNLTFKAKRKQHEILSNKLIVLVDSIFE